MIIGMVTGSVVASHKTNTMNGVPLRIVQKLNPQGGLTDSYVVAVDALGAAEGECVLVASGSTARQNAMTDAKPVDAIIMAIVDTWQIEGKTCYDKSTVQDMTS